MTALHPSNRRWMVHYRDCDGHIRRSFNLTAFVGTGSFDKRIAVLRAGVPDGWSFDDTEAGAQHRRVRVARRRHGAAMNRFLLSSIGCGDYRHPGDLADWMPRERNTA